MSLIAGGHMVVQCSSNLTLQLEICAIVEPCWVRDTTSVETYPSVLTTGDMVRNWVFWDVMLCHWVSGSRCFGGSCYLQSFGNHPCRSTALTTWKTWIVMNTTVRPSDVRCHKVACPHVACTVQATLCYMHWIILTSPPINLDQYPLWLTCVHPLWSFLLFPEQSPKECQLNKMSSKVLSPTKFPLNI
jgi:hypothetical protein